MAATTMTAMTATTVNNAELIVALDVQGVSAALELAKQLQGTVAWLKIGLELYIQAGPAIIKQLKELGFKIFLDLKMYDIPNTVYGGVLSACKMGVDLLTIHTQGGEAMAQAAMQAVDAFVQLAPTECATVQNGQNGQNMHKRPLIFGVTVLTSMKQGDLPLNAQAVDTLVLELAQKAHRWGLDGVVCSGQEVERIQDVCGKEFLCLTPGIRFDTSQSAGQTKQSGQDDQCRVMTPAKAVECGARFLVVGRPIIKADEPASAAQHMLRAMAINTE